MKNRKLLTILAAGCALITAVTAAGFAQRHFNLGARPDVHVQLLGSVERNSKTLPLDQSSIVQPQEVLDWNIVSENSGTAPATDYKTIGHIPRGTVYVADSASADGARTVYSIDGGKSFSPQPMVEAKQPDGTVKLVPAPVSMYTEIRYEWAEPLVSGGKLSASYKVKVK